MLPDLSKEVKIITYNIVIEWMNNCRCDVNTSNLALLKNSIPVQPHTTCLGQLKLITILRNEGVLVHHKHITVKTRFKYTSLDWQLLVNLC